MKIRWLRSGAASLRLHIDFIAADNPGAARRVRKEIRHSVLRLGEFPASGREGHVAETRELVVAGLPYIVVYRVGRETIDILRVFHTAQEMGGGPQ